MPRTYAFAADSPQVQRHPVHSLHRTATDESSLRLSLLPEDKTDVVQNEEIWKVANDCAFEPTRANTFVDGDVLAIGVPTELYSLLRSLSLPAMRASFLEILALVVEDENPDDSFSRVVDEDTRQALSTYMAIRKDPDAPLSGPHTGGLKPRELARSVETLLRLAEQSDQWRLPVTCLYVRAAQPRCSRMSIRDLSAKRRGKNQAEHELMWKLYSLHRPLLAALKNVDAPDLSMLLRDTVMRDPDAIPQALRLRHTLIAAKREANVFRELPAEVVEEHVVPNILLTLLQGAIHESPPASPDSVDATKIDAIPHEQRYLPTASCSANPA